MHFSTKSDDAAAVRQRLAETENRLRLFKSFSAYMNSGLSVQQVIERAIYEAHKCFSELRISYCTVDENRKLKIVCSASAAHMPSLQGREFHLSSVEAALFRSLNSEEIVEVHHAANDVRMQQLHELVRFTRTQAILLVPVIHFEDSLGFVSLASVEPHIWHTFERETLKDMAEYLAIAIREARTRERQLHLDLQMQQSQRMEAVGRLVGGIAHDFNNLLTAMMIYSGLLSTALGKQNRLHRYVEEIEGAGARGAELVGQLLSLTRQQVLEPKIISLNSIIDALRDMLQRLIGEDVILETHLSAELNVTRVDPTQIQQVILNLALNARDAMPKGGTLSLITENVTLGEDPVEGSPESAVGEFVRLRVHDTGQGMSKDVVALIFEPFFTTKEIGKGTGLGLASAYGIVRQHGGHIRVESSPGKGARFDIYFPVAGFDAATKDSEFTAAPESHEQPTILLVEDEACVRRPLLELLTTKGYKVLEAAEAEQAKKISAEMKQDIHLMITDLVMPGANGRELAEDLLKLRPEMKVLFMSGYTDDPRTRKLIADGVEFFRKPFSREGLLQKVSYMLRSEDDLMAS